MHLSCAYIPSGENGNYCPACECSFCLGSDPKLCPKGYLCCGSHWFRYGMICQGIAKSNSEEGVVQCVALSKQGQLSLMKSLHYWPEREITNN